MEITEIECRKVFLVETNQLDNNYYMRISPGKWLVYWGPDWTSVSTEENCELEQVFTALIPKSNQL